MALELCWRDARSATPFVSGSSTKPKLGWIPQYRICLNMLYSWVTTHNYPTHSAFQVPVRFRSVLKKLVGVTHL